MPITSQNQQDVANLYVALFGRAAEGAGFGYWADAIGNQGVSLDTIANQMFAVDAARAYYPLGATITQIATSFYINVLGRSPDTAGLAYWVDQLTQAGSSNYGRVINQMISATTAYAGTDPLGVDSKSLYTNKAAVSLAFSLNSANLNASQDAGKAILISVTKDTATRDAALIAANAKVGTTYTLTNAIDTLTGTSNDDTFIASLDTASTSTLNVADSLDGGAGTDTLTLTVISANALPAATLKNIEVLNVRAVAALTSGDLSSIASLTKFNADRSTANITTTNAAAGVQYGLLGDGAASFANNFSFGYASTVTAATLNLAGGVKATTGGSTVAVLGTAITSTTINSTGAANSLSTAASDGVISFAATNRAITINATADLTTLLGTTNETSLTVTGNANVTLWGVANNQALATSLTTIDASAMTGGGLKVRPGTSQTLKFTGGAGNDTLVLTNTFATGASVDGGAGTDTLWVGANGGNVTAASSAFIKNFELVDVTTATVDMDNFGANNAIVGLRIGGSATLSNINATTAGNITLYANATPVIGVKGATNSGQIDVVKITADDGLAAVNTLTLTAPTLTGVEILQLVATDNLSISSLTNATALTSIGISGGANVSITTGAVSVTPNAVVDASNATGNFSFAAGAAITNGYAVKGSSGVNTIVGAQGPMSIDLSKSLATADAVTLQSGAGASLTTFSQITGFTNAATTGDKLTLIATTSIAANVAAGTNTGVTNLTGTVANGVLTFGGTAAGTATLTDKLNAAFSTNILTSTQYKTLAFEDSGSTYVVQQADNTASFAAGTDLIVKLVGMTGITALSLTASASGTVFLG